MHVFRLLFVVFLSLVTCGSAQTIDSSDVYRTNNEFYKSDNHEAIVHYDSWFSRDKGLHLTGSIILTAGVTKCLERFNGASLEKARQKGMVFTMVIGLSKELYDGTKVRNRFSGKDLFYDILGTVIGGLILSID